MGNGKHTRPAAYLAAALLLAALCGCGEGSADILDSINSAAGFERPAESPLTTGPAESKDYEAMALREAGVTFEVLMPQAAGTAVEQNDKALIDYSNTGDGYVMVRFSGENYGERLRVLIDSPNGGQYMYELEPGGYETYPLSEGDGSYKIGVYEQVEGDRYALAATVTAQVALASEFEPFIRPNQYIDYTPESEAVRVSAALTYDAAGLLERIGNVYGYVTRALDYDTQLAAEVAAGGQSGYLPDVDAVLARKRGICFDYGSLMASMLRCQGIPAKLVVGYAGEAYHAWLSVYSAETGWIDDAVYFDGESWTLMDPTFAASGADSANLAQYIGDGSNYTPRFHY